MSSGYKPDYWDGVRSGENDGEAPEPAQAQQAAAAPVEAPKRLIGWRTPDYLYETNDPEKAKNWEPAVGVQPIFEGDIHTKLAAPTPAEPAPAAPAVATPWDGCEFKDSDGVWHSVNDAIKAALAAAPAQEASTPAIDRERFLAIREGHHSAAEREYFDARPQIDTGDRRRVFYAGFCKGYDASSQPPAGQQATEPRALRDDLQRTLGQVLKGAVEMGWIGGDDARELRAALAAEKGE